MTYYVRYGFGKDQELLKEKYLLPGEGEHRNSDILIETTACFSSFQQYRIEIPDGLVYYSIVCYKPWLKELVEWLNKQNGVNVKIVKTYRTSRYLVGISYEKIPNTYNTKRVLKDFKFGEQFLEISNKPQEDLAIAPINKCVLAINIEGNKTNLAKIILEYLILTLIRTLSITEAFFDRMEDKGTIIERIIAGSTNEDSVHNGKKLLVGHCLYEYKIDEDKLAFCLNIDNVESIIDGEKYTGKKAHGYRISQTPMIDSILEYKEKTNE